MALAHMFLLSYSKGGVLNGVPAGATPQRGTMSLNQ